MSRIRALGTPLVLIGLCSCLFSLTHVSAVTADISQAYHADSSIPDGSIVSLDPSRKDYIELANNESSSRLIGVSVAQNGSLLSVDASDTTVQVATSGEVSTLVTDVDGNISVGDQISVSPFEGIGMKAIPNLQVIGVAQNAFNANSKGAETRQVKNKNGQSTTIHVGYIPVIISDGTTTSIGNDATNSLQRLFKSLTGRSISTVRIVLSIVIAAVSAISLVVLIYASIYGSIVSVGRNPLARNDIFRTLLIVFVMSIFTAAVASVTVYLLLR